jgi:hypothetical protein
MCGQAISFFSLLIERFTIDPEEYLDVVLAWSAKKQARNRRHPVPGSQLFGMGSSERLQRMPISFTPFGPLVFARRTCKRSLMTFEQ